MKLPNERSGTIEGNANGVGIHYTEKKTRSNYSKGSRGKRWLAAPHFVWALGFVLSQTKWEKKEKLQSIAELCQLRSYVFAAGGAARFARLLLHASAYMESASAA